MRGIGNFRPIVMCVAACGTLACNETVGSLERIEVPGATITVTDTVTVEVTTPVEVDLPDSDGDGIPDVFDAFPDDPDEWVDADGDGVGHFSDCDDNDDNVAELTALYVDSDGDGYGTDTIFYLCHVPNELAPLVASITSPTDCDDLNPSIFQDGYFYIDNDEDGYAISTTTYACIGATIPNDLTDVAPAFDDCDDSDNAVFRLWQYYEDRDGDGATTAETEILAELCATDDAPFTPIGTVLTPSAEDDCDDNDRYRSPLTDEVWGNDIDEDCDSIALDADGDGYAAVAHGGDDCDDADYLTHPGATEIPDDGKANDCVGDDLVANDGVGLYVDISDPGCAGGDGNKSSPFCEIQEAVGVAANGDVIFVAAGMYEPVEISTLSLNLFGGYTTGGTSSWTKDPLLYQTLISADAPGNNYTGISVSASPDVVFQHFAVFSGAVTPGTIQAFVIDDSTVQLLNLEVTAWGGTGTCQGISATDSDVRVLGASIIVAKNCGPTSGFNSRIGVSSTQGALTMHSSHVTLGTPAVVPFVAAGVIVSGSGSALDLFYSVIDAYDQNTAFGGALVLSFVDGVVRSDNSSILFAKTGIENQASTVLIENNTIQGNADRLPAGAVSRFGISADAGTTTVKKSQIYVDGSNANAYGIATHFCCTTTADIVIEESTVEAANASGQSVGMAFITPAQVGIYRSYISATQGGTLSSAIWNGNSNASDVHVFSSVITVFTTNSARVLHTT